MQALAVLILAAAAAAQQSSQQPAPVVAPPASAMVEENGLRQLLTVRRVYVDRLTGGETAAQMRDILISALEGSKLFVLTENQERADTTLHGAAEDLVFTDTHSSNDSINARANVGTGRSSSSSRGSGSSAGLGENEIRREECKQR